MRIALLGLVLAFAVACAPRGRGPVTTLAAFGAVGDGRSHPVAAAELESAGLADRYPAGIERDTLALAEALASAGPNSRVTIGRGVYRLSSPEPLELRPASGVTLDGGGSVWLGEGQLVTLQSPPGERSSGLTLERLAFRETTLRFSAMADLTLRGLRLTGAAPTKQEEQLRLSHVDGALLSDCHFRRPESAGRSLRLYRSHDVRVEGSSWRGRFRTAINVFSSGGAPDFPLAQRNVRIAIVGNRIVRDPGDYPEDHGIYAWGMHDLEIRDNEVRGWSLSASGGAVKVRNGEGVRIVDNRFEGSGVLLYTYAVDGAPPWLRDVTIERNRIDLRGARPGKRGRIWERRAGISYWRNFRSAEAVEASIRIVDNVVRGGTISVLGVTDHGAFELRGNELSERWSER